MLDNFVNFEYFFTKLSGIYSCEKRNYRLGGHAWRNFFMACSKHEAMAIYVCSKTGLWQWYNGMCVCIANYVSWISVTSAFSQPQMRRKGAMVATFAGTAAAAQLQKSAKNWIHKNSWNCLTIVMPATFWQILNEHHSNAMTGNGNGMNLKNGEITSCVLILGGFRPF